MPPRSYSIHEKPKGAKISSFDERASIKARDGFAVSRKEMIRHLGAQSLEERDQDVTMSLSDYIMYRYENFVSGNPHRQFSVLLWFSGGLIAALALAWEAIMQFEDRDAPLSTFSPTPTSSSAEGDDIGCTCCDDDGGAAIGRRAARRFLKGSSGGSSGGGEEDAGALGSVAANFFFTFQVLRRKKVGVLLTGGDT